MNAVVSKIPRVIHYCWFGGRPLPPEARRCLDSWRRIMPDCRIERWDESRYPVDAIPYTAEAARMGLWAFVSDYARFDLLYRYGGIYFDTDVELIAPIDDILAEGAFMGWEKTETSLGVNPGLGIAAPAGHPFCADVVEAYRRRPFVDAEGRRLEGTVVSVVTDLLLPRGLRRVDSRQDVAGFTIYPSDYFSPLDDLTGRLTITPNTRSIHHYAKTWVGHSRLRTLLSRFSHRFLGLSRAARLKRWLRLD